MCAADFLREAEVLRRQVNKEERETIGRHGVRELFKEIQDQMNHERRADAGKVQQQLQSLRKEVFRFREQLIDLRPSPDVVDKLKDTMTRIESSIVAFKEMQHHRFEQLLREECILQQEMAVCEQQLALWSLPHQATAGPLAQTHTLSHMHSFPKETQALQSFLQVSGGRCGGWEEQEHQRFFRIYRKYRGKVCDWGDMERNLPGRSRKELEDHWHWTDTLHRLQQRQREAIKSWRCTRLKQQQDELNQQQQLEHQELQENLQHQERLLMDSEMRRKAEKEALEAWRNQRSLDQKEQEQLQLCLVAQQHRREREEQRRREEARLKRHEQERKRKMEKEEELKRMEEEQRREREERQRLAEETIPLFQNRDRARLARKRQQQQIQEQQKLQQQQRLQQLKSKVEVQVGRDSRRLLKHTAVWQERVKLIGPSETPGTILLSQTFRRAVPSWRKEP